MMKSAFLLCFKYFILHVIITDLVRDNTWTGTQHVEKLPTATCRRQLLKLCVPPATDLTFM